MADVNKGLRDIAVAQSSISIVDGIKGELRYRGILIQDLARFSTFEETTYLLWYEHLPRKSELESFRQAVARETPLSKEYIAFLKAIPKKGSFMSWMRTAVSALSCFDESLEEAVGLKAKEQAIKIFAKVGPIVATLERLRQGQDYVPPSPELSYAANFLLMLRGRKPEPIEEQVLDKSLILHADHELNASAFAARVTAGTLSDAISALTSAIGTLKGPLHGGANQNVMKMLTEIDHIERVEPYIREKLARHERISGFGHAVYRVEDPRAAILRRFCDDLARFYKNPKWADLSQKVVEVVQRDKGLFLNVDFYSASCYAYLGFPLDIYPPIFAIGRTPGWLAQLFEQYADNRLIRPRSEYIGPKEAPYVPIDQR